MSSPTSPSVRASAVGGLPAVALAALCWGTSGVSGGLVAARSGLGPLDIAWSRMAVGALALLAAHRLARRRRAPRAPLTRAVVVRLALVAAGLAVYQLAYFAAVARAGVAVATLVALGVAPLLVALAGPLLGAGRPDRATSGALAAALTGLVLLVGLTAAGTGSTGGGTGAVLAGALLACGSAAGYAVVTLAGGGLPAGTPVTVVGFTGGALLLTPAVVAGGLAVPGDPLALGTLLYLGLVPSALAYGLFFTGLRTVPGAVASIVTLLEPVTATALATLVLGQHLPAAALAGGVLVLGAVAVLSVRGRGAQAPRPATRRSASGRRSATRG